MKKIIKIFFAGCFSFLCLNVYGWNTIPPGGFKISGIPVTCGPAPTYLYDQTLGDPPLGDIAITNTNGIAINWPLFQQLPPVAQFFTYAHECGHIIQILSGSPINEDQADFYALKIGKAQGFLNLNGIQVVCSYLWSSLGDWTHKPGPVRCNNMLSAFPYI